LPPRRTPGTEEEEDTKRRKKRQGPKGVERDDEDKDGDVRLREDIRKEAGRKTTERNNGGVNWTKADQKKKKTL
jgi:hypothetical protein